MIQLDPFSKRDKSNNNLFISHRGTHGNDQFIPFLWRNAIGFLLLCNDLLPVRRCLFFILFVHFHQHILQHGNNGNSFWGGVLITYSIDSIQAGNKLWTMRYMILIECIELLCYFLSSIIFYNLTCIVLSNHLFDPFMLHPCPVTIWVNISWWLTPSSLRLWIERSRQTINKHVSMRERFSLLDVFSEKMTMDYFRNWRMWKYYYIHICTIMKVRHSFINTIDKLLSIHCPGRSNVWG